MKRQEKWRLRQRGKLEGYTPSTIWGKRSLTRDAVAGVRITESKSDGSVRRSGGSAVTATGSGSRASSCRTSRRSVPEQDEPSDGLSSLASADFPVQGAGAEEDRESERASFFT